MGRVVSWMAEKTTKGKTYFCIFCGQRRKWYDKTEINYQGEWMKGCSSCFQESIINVIGFNNKLLFPKV